MSETYRVELTGEEVWALVQACGDFAEWEQNRTLSSREKRYIHPLMAAFSKLLAIRPEDEIK